MKRTSIKSRSIGAAAGSVVTAAAVIAALGSPAQASVTAAPSAPTSVKLTTPSLTKASALQLTTVAQQVALTATQTYNQALVASGSCTITKGAGRTIYGDFVGMYMCNGVAIVCPDPLKNTASPASIYETGTVYYPNSTTQKLTALEVAELNDVMTTYVKRLNVGGASYGNNDLGAAARLASWKFAHQTSRLNRDLPYASSSVKALYNTIVAHAVANAGPYKLTKVSQTNAGINGTGVVTYKVTSLTSGKAIKGFVAKATTSSNATVVSTTSSDAYGTLKVTYRRTKWGTITGNLVGSSPSGKVRYYQPQLAIWQRFFSAATPVPVKASFSSTVSATNVGVGYVCGVGCVDAVQVTPTSGKICNTYGNTAKFVGIDNGVATTQVLQLASGACGTKNWAVADGHTFQLRLDVLVGSSYVSSLLPDKIKVSCPKPPALVLQGSLDCLKGHINVTAPANSLHAVRVDLSGTTTVSITAPAGQSATASVDFDCSTGVTWTGSVQRDDSSWHSGKTFRLAATN